MSERIVSVVFTTPRRRGTERHVSTAHTLILWHHTSYLFAPRIMPNSQSGTTNASGDSPGEPQLVQESCLLVRPVADVFVGS